MSSKDYLVSLLKIEDNEIVMWALDQLSSSVEADWFWFIDKCSEILEVASRIPEYSHRVNLLVSRLYFFANDMSSSVTHALKAGDLFDPSKRDLYTDNILTLIMNRYVQAQNGKLEMEEEEVAEHRKVVEKVLNHSLTGLGKGDNYILLGLSVETKNFDFFKLVIKQLTDFELRKMFDFMSNRVFEHELKSKILHLFLEEFKNRENKFSYCISKTLFLLGYSQEHADFLIKLVQSKREKSGSNISRRVVEHRT